MLKELEQNWIYLHEICKGLDKVSDYDNKYAVYRGGKYICKTMK